jgi:hypothetical protein
MQKKTIYSLYFNNNRLFLTRITSPKYLTHIIKHLKRKKKQFPINSTYKKTLINNCFNR